MAKHFFVVVDLENTLETEMYISCSEIIFWFEYLQRETLKQLMCSGKAKMCLN